MNEQHYIIRSLEIRKDVAKAVMAIRSEPLMEVIIKPYEKIRTEGQNARYWATLTEELRNMNATIMEMSKHTGYTPLEVRRLVSHRIQPEYAALLFVRDEESAHDILKMIHDIPTSTRLGTKAFMEFEERMLQTAAEVTGAVRAVARDAE